MGKWKKDKSGRFAGSAGEGKDKVPQPQNFGRDLSKKALNQEGQASPVDYSALSQAVEKIRTPSTAPKEIDYLPAAEQGVEDAAQRWENARSWAYPGVGDEEAEQELAESYEELSLARENLHRARILAAQTPEGRAYLEAQIGSWNSHAEAATETDDGALKYLVRSQEIYDALAEADRQSQVEDEFKRIIASSRSLIGGD